MILPRACRLLAGACVFLLPACVLRLNDRNEPLPNGGVTGPTLDCASARPLPGGAPGGDAVTKLVGRFDLRDPNRPSFDWSGNTMSARFEGSEVTWGVERVKPLDKDDQPEFTEMIFEVIIDGERQEVMLPDYSLDVKNPITSSTHRLSPGTHEITVVRSSEAISGRIAWVPFTFPGGRQLPPTQRPRRIEYIGDSITCGYGNEGPNATCPYDVEIKHPDGTASRVPKTENVVLAYGSLAAQALDADAVTLCYSGKGVYLNYREQNGKVIKLEEGQKNDPDAETTIPQYWLRTYASQPKSPEWDFTKEPEPQVVFINIGTNDFARDVNQNSITDYQEAAIPGVKRFDPAEFTAQYKKFVQFVRTKRPNAHIFIALPPMTTDKFPIDDGRKIFRESLSTIVRDLNGSGDEKVYFVELVEMGVRYGLGCDYHPNLEVHRIMADQVAGAIRSKTCW